MDIRRITDDYAVSGQIAPEDVAAVAAAGFETIICNRPDMEIPADLHADKVRAAAEAAGLAFVDLPVTHGALDDELITRQREIVETASAPVFAYCASGNRCSIVWALGQRGLMSADDILAATAAAGYDQSRLRPYLE